ncbi:MAG: ATP-dependent helicase [Candidatus Diapherotrites archaeon]|uniref:ATP-dependent helicase n=1 Tax=Candidatus Iainarchaeum sp. TaxID=3101447 RepID=A0A8T4L0W7_9ARCH|nr:ATP-dependent helicase [Candidatus Diapherotrites archaeon]
MPVEFQTEKHSDAEIYKALNPLLGAWFKHSFGSFTEPQRYAILNVHNRLNTLISAPTGTGKTLSAFAAILNELINLSEAGQLEDKVYCVYISPLRALSNDINRNLLQPLEEISKAGLKIGKKINVRVGLRTGDTTTSERAKMLSKPPHILITTPESLAILLNSPRFKELLREAKWCILDEVHALAENKRGVHLSLSLERLQELSPEICRIGLSATIAPLENVAEFLVGMKDEKQSRDCKIVDVRFLKKLDLKVLSPLPDLINVTQKQIHEKLYEQLHSLIQEHKTTLVFTNTRSATERVVHNLKEKFPQHYSKANLEAHHSSLSREHRLNVEQRLKDGKLKAVVCSTSLELGIDIGFIDLVILLGSPKSVARTLQRVGRSGHKLHDTVKGRIIVLDRDDLVECSVLLKNAIEHKIDKISIPENCLDVLAQQIFGIAIDSRRKIDDVFRLVKKSYCYRSLQRTGFDSIISYLSGEFSSLESRHVYAKIWFDEKTGEIGKRGKLARVLYLTNIGTIPEEARVKVKLQGFTIGTIDEGFLERLRKGDVFVLGGQSYVFSYANGMTAFVRSAEKRPPTVPSWFSEMLPLSFDLALEIQKFRRLMLDQFRMKKSRSEILEFLNSYLYVDKNASSAIFEYFREQFLFSQIPNDKKLLVENFSSEGKNHAVFHACFGRRTVDALSRALAFASGRLLHEDVEIGLNDNGFVLSASSRIPLEKAISLLKSAELRAVLEKAIDDSEVLRRRFRHCATRSLMILRSYKGREKSVGRQQLSSRLLLAAVLRISRDFPILREARREVLEDLMDIKNALKVLEMIEKKELEVKSIETGIPSPFALNLYTEGYSDIMKVEGRLEFVKRMHEKIMEKIRSKA